MDYGSRWWQDYNQRVRLDNQRDMEAQWARDRPGTSGGWKRTKIDVPVVSSKWLWLLAFIGGVMGIGAAPELGATALTGGLVGGFLGLMVIPVTFALWWITVITLKIALGSFVLYILYQVFANSG